MREPVKLWMATIVIGVVLKKHQKTSKSIKRASNERQTRIEKASNKH